MQTDEKSNENIINYLDKNFKKIYTDIQKIHVRLDSIDTKSIEMHTIYTRMVQMENFCKKIKIEDNNNDDNDDISLIKKNNDYDEDDISNINIEQPCFPYYISCCNIS